MRISLLGVIILIVTSAEQIEPYLPGDKADQIRRITTALWRSRRGVGRVIEAAFREQALSGLVGELDSAIGSLNGIWLGNPGAEVSHLWNIQALDMFLDHSGNTLPSLQISPDLCSKEETGAMLRTTLDMRPLMERAERSLSEPKLTFAANETLSEQQALLGGTLQFAGRYLTRMMGEDPARIVPVWQYGSHAVETDLPTVIMDALLELPVANNQPLQYDYFRTAQEMGWYGPGGPFSPEVVLWAANHSV